MSNVQITLVTQVATSSDGSTATVGVSYQIQGPPPDFLQLYAVNAASADPSAAVQSNWVADFDLSGYQQIQLAAGTIYTLLLCPRTGTQDNPDQQFNGEYWEDSCAVYNFTTTTAGPPSGSGMVPPKIISVSSQPAKVNQGNSITINWSSPSTYQKFLIANTYNGEPLAQGQTEGQPPANSWTLTTAPGNNYTFQVKGGVSGGFSWSYSDWGPMVSATAAPNLRSLRQFLTYSEVNLSGFVLSSLMPANITLREFMQL